MRVDRLTDGRPALSAVAAVAGTSVPTVSKVLRGGTDVSPEMRLKVAQASPDHCPAANRRNGRDGRQTTARNRAHGPE